jgi:hypothetical protein
VITVTLREFASLPDIDSVPARMMTLVDEPRTGRLFVSEMRGVLYTVSQDGKTVTPYLDLRDPKWALAVQLRAPCPRAWSTRTRRITRAAIAKNGTRFCHRTRRRSTSRT